MKLEELQDKINTPLFFDYEVSRHFPDESKGAINVQLSRLAQKGKILKIKKGLYVFPNRRVDPFVIAGLIYKPSYISLESALNYWGLLPDVPSTVTSVTTTTTKIFHNIYGRFSYSKIKKDIFDPFAVVRVGDANSIFYFDIAFAEEALLEFVYIRHITNLDAHRIDLQKALSENVLSSDKLESLSKKFPLWVKKVIYE